MKDELRFKKSACFELKWVHPSYTYLLTFPNILNYISFVDENTYNVDYSD